MASPSHDLEQSAWELGRSRWPDLAVSREQFVGYARTRGEAEPDWAHLFAGDLFLACACVEGVAGAPAAFHALYRDDVVSFVMPVVKNQPAAIELCDDILVELLVGPEDGRPRLAGYSGRGPLRAWLRMTAVRRALNASRDRDRHKHIEARLLNEAVAATSDPETGYLKQRYGADFAAAFRDALPALPVPQRALLHLHHGQGVALDVIAAMNRWSRPTASRRVAAARDALLEGACALLRRRLGVSEAELESLFRLVRSQLDEGLGDLLRQGER